MYFHSETTLPIRTAEKDQDSEDETIPEWMRVKTIQVIVCGAFKVSFQGIDTLLSASHQRIRQGLGFFTEQDELGSLDKPLKRFNDSARVAGPEFTRFLEQEATMSVTSSPTPTPHPRPPPPPTPNVDSMLVHQRAPSMKRPGVLLLPLDGMLVHHRYPA